ncbi:hypothetical protein DFH07DRAFT_862251 [Mycena maculata]|uniref:Uncharacterized protein n=1 Tax=Mycena maculata TaxID=230809 RepID=A0AAD7MGK2_9AGAR|nr:hypothetical protein DFH07DRAFT_862251 [Mycena maculata]
MVLSAEESPYAGAGLRFVEEPWPEALGLPYGGEALGGDGAEGAGELMDGGGAREGWARRLERQNAAEAKARERERERERQRGAAEGKWGKEQLSEVRQRLRAQRQLGAGADKDDDSSLSKHTVKRKLTVKETPLEVLKALNSLALKTKLQSKRGNVIRELALEPLAPTTKVKKKKKEREREKEKELSAIHEQWLQMAQEELERPLQARPEASAAPQQESPAKTERESLAQANTDADGESEPTWPNNESLPDLLRVLDEQPSSSASSSSALESDPPGTSSSDWDLSTVLGDTLTDPEDGVASVSSSSSDWDPDLDIVVPASESSNSDLDFTSATSSSPDAASDWDPDLDWDIPASESDLDSVSSSNLGSDSDLDTSSSPDSDTDSDSDSDPDADAEADVPPCNAG